MSEEKKQRKKLNIIDLIVIVLLATVVVFVVIRGVELFRVVQMPENGMTEDPENALTMPEDFEPNLRFVLVTKNIDGKLAARIAKAEQLRLYSDAKLLDAYITDIELRPNGMKNPGAPTVDPQTQKPIPTDIVITVEAKVDMTDPKAMINGNFNPLIGNQEIRIGRYFTLKTMEIELSCAVYEVEELHADP